MAGALDFDLFSTLKLCFLDTFLKTYASVFILFRKLFVHLNIVFIDSHERIKVGI